MKITEKHTYKLLVEGNDDQHVIWSFCQHHQLAENFDVIDCNSIENVLGQLKTRLSNPSAHQRIGIVIDADVDLNKRKAQILEVLRQSQKYNCADCEWPASGLILKPIDSYDATIGIWIMPDNNINGMLEDFIISLASEADPLMQKAESILNELEESQIQQYKSVHRSKAKIHTFLAWQDEPGKPMGTAITAKILNPNSEHAEVFVHWIKQLFT